MEGALKYVCMNGCKSHALWRMGIRRVYDVMYVCVGKQTSLENGRYVCLLLVCMYVWGNIHT